MGMSGEGPLREILDEMLEEPQDEEEGAYHWGQHVLDTTLDVAKFMNKFMELFEEKGDADSEDEVGLLFVTPKKIFCTMGRSNVSEIASFAAVGSGSDYAIGALEILQTAGKFTAKSLETSVHKAIEVACKWCVGCEAPIEVISVDIPALAN